MTAAVFRYSARIHPHLLHAAFSASDFCFRIVHRLLERTLRDFAVHEVFGQFHQRLADQIGVGRALNALTCATDVPVIWSEGSADM